ncbi:hypothetical protein FPV67DRAFT_930193 [Lyophyllum atratum]|nr:hypothetical protein FPV67DRAFT_930193 [Lyophyllum atratum]
MFSAASLALFTLTLAMGVSAQASETGTAPSNGTAPGAAQVITSCTVNNTVALAFDDGPSQYLQHISDILVAKNATGTFFVNGLNYDCIYDPEPAAWVKYAYDAGHQIGSHTWHHLHLIKLNETAVTAEFSRTALAIQQITGAFPAFTRPPYGEYNQLVQQVAQAQGQTLVTWDFDSADSIGDSAKQSQALYAAQVLKHPVNMLTLNHDVYKSTAYKLLPYAINKLQDAGYKLVTVAECLGRTPYWSVGNPAVRNNATWVCTK